MQDSVMTVGLRGRNTTFSVRNFPCWIRNSRRYPIPLRPVFSFDLNILNHSWGKPNPTAGFGKPASICGIIRLRHPDKNIGSRSSVRLHADSLNRLCFVRQAPPHKSDSNDTAAPASYRPTKSLGGFYLKLKGRFLIDKTY